MSHTKLNRTNFGGIPTSSGEKRKPGADHSFHVPGTVYLSLRPLQRANSVNCPRNSRLPPGRPRGPAVAPQPRAEPVGGRRESAYSLRQIRCGCRLGPRDASRAREKGADPFCANSSQRVGCSDEGTAPDQAANGAVRLSSPHPTGGGFLRSLSSVVTRTGLIGC